MKKVLVILSVCLLLVFVSGCSQRAQPDQDLSEEELNSMYSLALSGGDVETSLDLYFNKLWSSVYPDTPSVFDKISPDVLKDGNLASKEDVEKGSINISWSGPDANGWYTKTEINILGVSYLVRIRYFSSLKKLEYERSYIVDNKYTYAESKYLIFNKDIRQDITHAYPVSGQISLLISNPSEANSNKNNVTGTKLVLENMGLASLNQSSVYVLVGSIRFYVTYINYDDTKPEVDNKLMIEAISKVGADGKSLDISGRCDADGNIYTDGDKELSINISL
ncbi:MAG TPA: hypothetical protein PLS98_05365 [Dictyoglomaceae bacterium]|nr:hypothetical protein [Dictyoglomaceae bacterium]